MDKKPRPPQYLLAEWEQFATPKSRGRTGPHPPPAALATSHPPTSAPTTSAIESLVAVLAASTTVMVNNMLQNSENQASQPSQPAKRPASPLPEVRDWLNLCISSFGEERGLPRDTITTAIATLAAKSYTPHELGNDRLDIDHISELTNLPEGVVVGLRNFAGEWVKRQTAKRSRLE